MSTHFINGQWVTGAGLPFTSLNPATGETIWQGNAADSAQVNAAVAAAANAAKGWAATPYDARVAILTRFRDLVKEKTNGLTDLICQETGKIRWDAANEAGATVGKLALSLQAYADRTPTKHGESGGLTTVIRHRPHGVMAVYGPYNFPAHLPNGHIMPALLAGNTIVFKPSEMTPIVGQWMVKQWQAAGIPAGVVNLVQGERETGKSLSSAPINGLLFTGSSQTGKILHQLFAGRPEVILALELGGNNPLIVDHITDIKAAVLETILSAYQTSGQRCTCARRLIVVESAPSTPAFLAALQNAVSQLKVGSYTDSPEPFMGPLINNREADRLLAAQEMLEKSGGKVLVRMKRLHATLPFISPALIDTTAMDNRIDEEYFGPLLQIIRVKTLDDAIIEANNTAFGLSSGLLCDDKAKFEHFVQHIHAGIANWNRQTTGSAGTSPFGGVGCSGNHHPAGYYAADYCAYPTASIEKTQLSLPETLPSGVVL